MKSFGIIRRLGSRRSAKPELVEESVAAPEPLAESEEILSTEEILSADERTAIQSLFDPEYYRKIRPDVIGDDETLLGHYLRHGWMEGCEPHPSVSTRFYLQTAKGAKEAGINPLLHHIRTAPEERRPFFPVIEWPSDLDDEVRDMHPYFDFDFYRKASSEFLTASDYELILHYALYGWREGRDPSADFSTQFYLQEYPDIKEGGLNPFLHYIHFGRREERKPYPNAVTSWLRTPSAGSYSQVQGVGSLHVAHEDGRTIVINSENSFETIIYFNRVPTIQTSLVKGLNHIIVPNQWLTGEPTLLELRDDAKDTLLLQTVILPPRILTPAEFLVKESRPPFPAVLFSASSYRFAAIRAHAREPIPGIEMDAVAKAIDSLEAGHERVRLEVLSFPVIDEPTVSIIIPAHNKIKVTYSCLCALLLAWNRTTFEVILVDDGSTDETCVIETMVSGITVVRNAEAQMFIRACNSGAAKARGKYIVLLNNDTEPTTGWLDNLVDAFSRFPNVGLVGSKLLFPNGRLQDAGGIIWRNGNPWNYGSGQNPWEPRYCYARQADYLSGASLMVPRTVWDEVGGLSSYLEPMYFEDTDLSFKVRESGYKTWFIPSSVVFHHEGLTAGTDTSTGFKRFQEVNRPKFKNRWSGAFLGFSQEGRSPDREKDRGIVGRVLFVDYTTPRADQDAGGHAALQEIKMVQALGFKVTFLPENVAHLGEYTLELERQGVEVIVAPFFGAVNDYLERHAADFDALYVTRYHVANKVVPKFRSKNPDAKVIMNNADLHFLRMLRAVHSEGKTDQLANVDKVRVEELAAMRSVDLVLSYSDVEHAVIHSHTRAEVKVAKCPWVVDLPESVLPRETRNGLSFLGSFRHFPNVDGIKWLVKEVMPLVAESLPDTVLSIYGSGMDQEIRSLEGPHVRPVGFVDHVTEAFDPHLIFVAPLLSGAGIKGKVMAAMSHGIPCVLSPLAAEGIGLRSGYDCLICRTPQDWVQAITVLHNDSNLWHAIAQNARSLIAENFTFERGVLEMRAAFEMVGM